MSAKTRTWVDFRELRSRLRLAQLLDNYHVELKVKGDRATGFCPLPGHPRHSGKRHSPSFSANLARGLFQCFGCGAKGNVLDFACYMEGVDPSDTKALRDVALKLQDRFGLGSGDTEPPVQAEEHPPEHKQATPPTPPAPAVDKPRKVNVPIDFELKTLDPKHAYLAERGFSPETIDHFGLGYCSRGIMAERIAIPLHDAAGNLIGYAGRLVNDTKITDETPKYRFPGDRERDGIIYEFHKSLFLYNGHRITSLVKDLVVVEGFPSVWWLWQNGHHHVVALMGSSCSREQATVIVNLVAVDGHVWAFPDGDDAGKRCAESVFAEVGKHRFVRWVGLDDAQQPTNCSPSDLSLLLPPNCFQHPDQGRKDTSHADDTNAAADHL